MGNFKHVELGVDDEGNLKITYDGGDTIRPLSDLLDIPEPEPILRPAILLTTKGQGVNGGTPSATSWNTRTLDVESDPDGIVTVASNQFTLPEGEYLIEAWSVVWGVNHHKARIRDVTNSVNALLGLSGYASAESLAMVSGRIESDGATVYSLQHYTEAAPGDYALGQAVGQGTEVYAGIKITKEVV